MALPAGTRLGPYVVTTRIGEGGMGEVYGATDTRLGRDVAIKVLPPALAADPHFRARFDREARAISQLTHPHICRLYDVGEAPSPESTTPTSEPVRFLVMELLQGDTLASKLTQARLPAADAVRIGIEIVSALDVAHRAGIVHRDLKPGNVMITKSGAKLLDFGLAKQSAPATETIGATTAEPVTVEGTILGTLPYMAPEQLEGGPVDGRTDIFAFGCVLYEMLTGTKAFSGNTRASLISSIMSAAPAPLSTLAPQTPPALERVVRTCLAKSPDDRFHSAHDLLLQLQWIAEGDTQIVDANSTAAPSSRRRDWVAWSVAAAAIIAALVAVVAWPAQQSTPPLAPVQFSLSLPDTIAFNGTVPRIAVSPDGRHIAIVANSLMFDNASIWVRMLEAPEFKPLQGTDSATYPFWSPDSRFIAFVAGGRIMRVPVTGGPATTVCETSGTNLGIAWSPANEIVFGAGPGGGGLRRVPASGGAPEPFTTLDPSRDELDHRWPTILPDGRHVLFLAVGKGETMLKVASLDSANVSLVGPIESSVAYASGRLVSLRAGNLVTQAFDPVSLTVSGEPVAIATEVGADQGRFTSFSVSQNGVLIYGQRSGGGTSRLAWLDRSGRQTGTVGDSDQYGTMSLSPNGARIAVNLAASQNSDIWTIDLARGSLKSRLTVDPGVDINPIWSPEGTRVAFTGNAQGTGLYLKGVDQADEPRLLMRMDGVSGPSDWSSDGRFILYWNSAEKTNSDLWLVPTDGTGKPSAFARGPAHERDGKFSPDMRWIAYASDESGNMEVYAQPFPQTGAKHKISRDGGKSPHWRGDGKELYFLTDDATMMAVTIDTSRGFSAGVPQALFSLSEVALGGRARYSVTPDGQRFLFNLTERPGALTVLLHWPIP